MKRKALLEAYNSPSNEELPAWKKDKGLMEWLKKKTRLFTQSGSLFNHIASYLIHHLMELRVSNRKTVIFDGIRLTHRYVPESN